MANRNFPSSGKIYSFNVMPVMINLQITIGASGAVTSFTGKGVASVAKSATGKYLITLQDNYYSLLALLGNAKVASGTSGLDHIEQIGSFANSSDPASSGATVSIQTVLAGSVANATSGAVLNIVMLLNNSSVQ